MTEFKKGDRVRRTSHFAQELGVYFLGEPFVLSEDFPYGWIKDPDDQTHSAKYIELVSPADTQEGPVRTRSVTEIVPGVYGLVTVSGVDAASRTRALISLQSFAPMTAMKADELDAAAIVFTSLAKALREQAK